MKEFILHLTKLISSLNSSNLELTDRVIFFKESQGAGKELFITTPQDIQNLIGGSPTPINPITVVTDYNSLPNPTTISNKFYWCSLPITHTTFFITFTDYENGLYYSNGITWEFLDVPMQLSQAETDAGLISDKFVTAKTLNNYSGWNKTKVGLDNIDNTSDVNKPVSTFQAAADAQTLLDAELYTDSIGLTKVDKTTTVNGYSLNSNVIVNKSDVGLSNVNNTSDANKPISTATQTALNLKQDSLGYTPENLINKDATGGYVGLTLFKINFKNVLNTFTSFFTNSNTASRTYIFQDRNGTIADDTDLGLKSNISSPTFTGTVSGITASMVGLGNVDNTSDTNKPVSIAQQLALSSLNPLNSVSLATITNISGLTYSNGILGVGATLTQNSPSVFTLDGVIPSLGDRILFKDQSSALTNGVYIITTLGTVSIPAVFTRAINYNQLSNINNSIIVSVIHGTINQTTTWSMVSTIVTMGITSITYVQSVYTRAQNDSRYFQLSNNLSDGVVATIKANLLLDQLSNNAQLTIANNLSDLNNTVTARTNLGLILLGKTLTPASGTNTTAEELITSFQIGSTNTINTNDILEFYSLIGWNSTAGNKTFKIYFSPTALLSDVNKILVGTSAVHTTNLLGPFTRRFIVLSNTSIQSNIPGAGLVDNIDSITSGTNIPTTITVPSLSAGFYVLISGLKTVGTDTDTVQYAYMRRVL